MPRSNPLLARPTRVTLPAALPCDIIGLADVASPLTGPSGAAHMFGPQKGADAALVEELESAMQGWATALREAGADVADSPGAGAAGGLGATILALGGTLEPGLSRIVTETDAGAPLAVADLVITGEGSLDAQTGMGKVPDAIARMAKADGRTPVVIALAGRVEGESHGAIDAAYCIHSRTRPLAEAMDPVVTLAELAATAERVVREWIADPGGFGAGPELRSRPRSLAGYFLSPSLFASNPEITRQPIRKAASTRPATMTNDTATP